MSGEKKGPAPFVPLEPVPYDAGWRDGYRARGAVAKSAGLVDEVPLPCCGGRLILDYEQLTPWGWMPTAMETHRAECPEMKKPLDRGAL